MNGTPAANANNPPICRFAFSGGGGLKLSTLQRAPLVRDRGPDTL